LETSLGFRTGLGASLVTGRVAAELKGFSLAGALGGGPHNTEKAPVGPRSGPGYDADERAAVSYA